ncbi:hypothetical protein JDN40_01340 [Rhodomicrobium vannielii ATCC 17100]|uniref:hypothetical protein n=1 Tax=Rhodomicrobium vannielii TaxID=1069 RepID=UPI00191965BF|nr:hypothetical protein [Rhodomicrobium vannielii]MBJ7532766.1 hypothetical protein [Rhodomicrobium vannielii ATCC 17100]
MDHVGKLTGQEVILFLGQGIGWQGLLPRHLWGCLFGRLASGALVFRSAFSFDKAGSSGHAAEVPISAVSGVSTSGRTVSSRGTGDAMSFAPATSHSGATVMVSGELADVTSSWLLALFSTGFFSTIAISVFLSDKKGKHRHACRKT